MSPEPSPRDESRAPKTRRWDVLHACDSVRDIADIVDAQISVGIRPYLLSRAGAESVSGLMQAWNDVRSWRRLLEDYAAPNPTATLVVHAHSFPAGMAAVRGDSPVVYDVHRFFEDQARAEGRQWLGRSFRAAEQFVLAQADAIVVHDAAGNAAASGRGARQADLFVVPAPLSSDEIPPSDWLQTHFGSAADTVWVFAPECTPSILTAVGKVSASIPGLRLATIEARGGDYLSGSVAGGSAVCLSEADARHALASCDVVITARASAAAQAMAYRRAVVALDAAEMRELTPEGRGCIWFDGSGDDLARRLSYLAAHREFRAALGHGGSAHIRETRSPERIGRRYEQVYQHAWSQRQRGAKPRQPGGLLIPAKATP